MTGYWNRAKTYLGLGTEEEYEYGLADLDPEPEPPRPARVRPAEPPSASRRPRPASAGARREERHVAPVDDGDEWEGGAVRVIESADSGPAGRGGEPVRRNVVRPMPTVITAKPKVVAPSSFNDAQQIGDLFRTQQPVILNVGGLDRDLARRLLDFASGVSYALSGSIERVSSHVYLLTPEDVEVSADDRQKLRDGVGGDGQR